MTNTYRVILIDPEARYISELESDCTLASIYELVASQGIDSFGLAKYEGTGCDGFDFGWVDDGALSRGHPVHAFLLPGATDPIGGRCVVIGADDHGETCNARLPLALLRQDVTWLGKILPEVTWDHTHGLRSIITYSRQT